MIALATPGAEGRVFDVVGRRDRDDPPLGLDIMMSGAPGSAKRDRSDIGKMGNSLRASYRAGAG